MRNPVDDETKNGQDNESNPPENKQALARVPVDLIRCLGRS